MKIAFFEIQNFRKLRSVRIELSERQTIFVGANNSGKTSAMHALDKFLKQSKERKENTDIEADDSGRWFVVEDFTLSLWDKINAIGLAWEDINPEQDAAPDLNLSEWDELLPSLDVWLEVRPDEYNYVHKLIPTLDWEGGLIGIRLRLEPQKDLSSLFSDYRQYRQRAKKNFMKAAALEAPEHTEAPDNAQEYMQRAFWPHDMKDFFRRRLPSYFAVKYYELDPQKLSLKKDNDGNFEKPQAIPEFSFAKEGDPFAGIIKIDAINAQRGFEDADASKNQKLASQFYDYLRTSLNPEHNPEPKDSDIKAILAVSKSEQLFDSTLQTSFAGPINELKDLGYPGVYSPSLQVRTKVQRKDVLSHAAAIQYSLSEDATCSSDHYLPEAYNGLGYQNLISMVFRLMRFRDAWMKPNKEAFSAQDNVTSPEPIHLVLVEEPEAHLHAQVQQVFIRKAYDVLRKHENLGKSQRFSTQLIVSTHSSHIAHECEFADIRYFQRIPSTDPNDVPHARVVNLTTVFSDNTPKKKAKAQTDPSEQADVEAAKEADIEAAKREATQAFVARYLKTTHCDLFFADAAIFIEGAGERILLPHFLKTFRDGALSSCYISLLEIGGSHAFRLKELIEHLGLTTLIITDLDSVKLNASTNRWAACPIGVDSSLKTANSTLKTWVPRKDAITELLAASENDKLIELCGTGSAIRVAYQIPISLVINGNAGESCPRTFEDAFILSNFKLFSHITKDCESAQFLAIHEKISTCVTHAELPKALFDLINSENSFKKSEFALEILFNFDLSTLEMPSYIKEGLKWLSQRLKLPNLQTCTPTGTEEANAEPGVVE